MTTPSIKLQVSPASPWKRLFAWVYDLLPAFGVLVLFMIVGLAVTSLIGHLFGVAFHDVSVALRNHPLWILYLAGSVSYYYLWCWQKAGQTVGHRTWRIKLVRADGQLLSWKDAFLRGLLSCGGIANLWAFVDGENRGWHDVIMDTYVVQLPKMEKTAEEKKPLI